MTRFRRRQEARDLRQRHERQRQADIKAFWTLKAPTRSQSKAPRQDARRILRKLIARGDLVLPRFQ